MRNKKKILLKQLICCICIAAFCLENISAVYADGQFSISPMNQKIVLTPGETYRSSFKITNPASNSGNFAYNVEVAPYYVDENHDSIYENNDDYNQMVDWIILDKNNGVVAPNDTVELYFSIEVPKNAPAGGQYAAIKITSDNNKESEEDAINIQAKYSIAHIICAEIAGTTIRQGEVFNAEVPSFLLTGDITGSSAIKNSGNVHGTAKYAMQIFPLFSSEEVYTNEEDPVEKTILPDRTLYNELTWEDTPPIGIFNVIYTVEFEGITTQVSKLVIICPIWLLFIIIFTIFALIFYFIAKSKARKKASQKANKN